MNPDNKALRIKQWIDAGLGVEPLRVVAEKMGLSRQRAHQMERELGLPHVEDRRIHPRTLQPGDPDLVIRLTLAVAAGARLSQACADAGMMISDVRTLERRCASLDGTPLHLPRGRRSKWTIHEVLSAIRSTPTLHEACRVLNLSHDTQIHRLIASMGLRDAIAIIREKQRLMADPQLSFGFLNLANEARDGSASIIVRTE